MANGRSKGSKGDSGRDAGGFAALPWSVLDCPAYAGLSHPARALLIEFARQFVRDNNGRLLASVAFLKTRGWFSAGVIQKAKQELMGAGFIFETVKGHRPNKASWYAVTWRLLDRLPGYDVGADQLFRRGAYRESPGRARRSAPTCKNPKKNASLSPPHGTTAALIVPPHGIESRPAIPSHGSIGPVLAHRSIPPHGHHLEKPSIAATQRPAGSAARSP